MNTRNLKTIALAIGFTAGGAGFAADKVTYEDNILPIFRNNCLKCHNPDKMKADLNLANYDALMNGSGTGDIVAGGDPDNSLLFQVVTHAEEPAMPPESKLADAEIATIKAWIAGGLLKDSGSKAVMADKPKIDLTIDPDSLGKRPEGPPPMPVEVFALDPYQRTQRTSVSTAIAVSPWAPLVAIGGQRQVLLYNTDTFKIAGIIPFPKGFPHNVNFSANGKLLVIGGGRGANLGFSTVWDITSGQQILTVGDDLDAVLATDISADQRYIAHGGPDRLVRIFSTDTGEMLHKIKKHTDWVTAMRFGPKGKYVASGDRAGGIHVWEAEPGGRAASLMGHRGRITGLEWASTNIVISASEDGTAKMWNIDEVRQLRSWTAHSGGALSLRRAQNGDLVTVGRNRRATLWNSSGTAKRSFTFTGDIPSTGVPSHDAKLVIGTDWNGKVVVWNAADGREVTELALNPSPMAEQFAASQKNVEAKAAAAKAATAAHQAVLGRIAKAKTQMTALDATVTMRQKAVTDSKAALAKLIAEKQKPAQAKVATATASHKTAASAKAAADKALAGADEAGKPAAQAKATAAAKALTEATAAKTNAEKALTAINAQVTQAGTVSAAAAKSLVEAQNAAKTGKAELTKLVGVLNTAANTEQAKVTAAGAALTAAQKEADLLRINKSYSAHYNARNKLAAQQAKLAEVQSAAKAAQATLDGTQAALGAARKTDLAKLKADKLVAFIQTKTAKAKADQALIEAQAEVAKAGEAVNAATQAIVNAEAGMETAGTNLTNAKAAHTRAAATAKAARDKANAAKVTYDQLAASKQAPAQLISTTLDKAIAQANTAKVNASRVLTAINAEINTAKAAIDPLEKSAAAAEANVAPAKAAMDKLSTDLAKHKTVLADKQKAQAAAKTALDQLNAEKENPDKAKIAAAQATLDTATKATAAAQAAVNTATANHAKAKAGFDAKNSDAIAKRKSANAAKAKNAQLVAAKQKPAQASLAAATATATELAAAKASAGQILTRVNAEMAEAAKPHQALDAAAKTMEAKANEAETVVEKMAAAMEQAEKLVAQRKSEANTAKAAVDKLTAERVKPMEAQVTEAATTMTAAQAAHENAEQDHRNHVAKLAKTAAIQTTVAKAKTDEAGKLASTVDAEQKRVEALKAEYEKLKTPTKTAAK